MLRFFRSRRNQELGPLEVTVMEVLWLHGEANVHDVAGRLDRPLAYTTVMTTLDRLYKKGLLDRRKSERAFFYSPHLSRDEWEQQQARELLAGLRSESLISCLVDVVEQQDEALLDELEKRIRMRRRELRRKQA
jgi:predicted transcriptional regulator